MPTYTVQDQETGKTIKFEWYGEEKPTDADIEAIIGQANQQPEKQPKDTQWKDLRGNILPSAIQAGKDITSLVSHPLQTGKALGTLATGTAMNLEDLLKKAKSLIYGTAPPRERDFLEKKFSEPTKAVGEQLLHRITHPKETLINDPVGAAFDLSTLLYGGAGLAPKAGSINKILKGTSTALDPIQAVGKGVKLAGQKIVSPTAKGIAAPIIGVTTGVGSEPVRQSAKRSTGFMKTLRRKKTAEEVAQDARGGLESLKAKRRTEYLDEFDQIENMPGDLDITPVKNKLGEILGESGIVRTDKGFDFTRASGIELSAEKDVEKVVKMVDGWGSKEGDLTAKGVDLLKKRLGEFYHPNQKARRIVSSLEDTTKKILEKEIPGYAKMTKKYSQASKQINEIQKALSLNDRAAVDTQLKKLMMTMKEDSDFRRSLIKLMEDESGIDLQGEISGLLMQDIIPKGFMGRSIATGQAFMLFQTWNPSLWAGLMATSPRMVGELINLTAEGIELINKASSKVYSRSAFQAGRASRLIEEKQ